MVRFRDALAAAIGGGVTHSNVVVVKVSNVSSTNTHGGGSGSGGGQRGSVAAGTHSVVVDFSILVRGYGSASVVVGMLTSQGGQFKQKLLKRLSEQGMVS